MQQNHVFTDETKPRVYRWNKTMCLQVRQIHVFIGETNPHVYRWDKTVCLIQVVSLVFDGLTGGAQDRIRDESHPDAHVMMVWMNVWSTLYLIIGKRTLLVTTHVA